jgi:MFS family permease
VGALFVKTISIVVLRRYGFRTVLVVNGALCALIVLTFAAFTATTPHLVVIVLLLLSGCLRSMQFTALQALTFDEIEQTDMSQAASISSMLQRLAQSLGIAIAAYLLQLSGTLQGHDTLVAADFPPTFIALALLALVAPFLHRRLSPDAGVAISGHTRR